MQQNIIHGRGLGPLAQMKTWKPTTDTHPSGRLCTATKLSSEFFFIYSFFNYTLTKAPKKYKTPNTVKILKKAEMKVKTHDQMRIDIEWIQNSSSINKWWCDFFAIKWNQIREETPRLWNVISGERIGFDQKVMGNQNGHLICRDCVCVSSSPIQKAWQFFNTTMDLNFALCVF
jgi:hypothetical protein